MKNKKKLIIGIVILLIISISCLLGILFTVKSQTEVADNIESSSTITEDDTQEETVENINNEENEQLENSSNEENVEAIIEETGEQQPKAENNQPTETSQVTASKSNDSENKSTTVNPQQTQPQQPIQNEKQQTVQQSSVSSQPKQTTTQTQTQSSQTQTTQTQKKPEGEKYVRNDTMINNIKRVINNNKSENMKTHGYTIQVDPSIKNKTNQFTYSESRVINLIKYSFGTIRVYAEDYYNNGQLIMTECYIF